MLSSIIVIFVVVIIIIQEVSHPHSSKSRGRYQESKNPKKEQNQKIQIQNKSTEEKKFILLVLNFRNTVCNQKLPNRFRVQVGGGRHTHTHTQTYRLNMPIGRLNETNKHKTVDCQDLQRLLFQLERTQPGWSRCNGLNMIMCCHKKCLP